MDERPPWIGEKPADMWNCVTKHPKIWGRITWAIKRRILNLKVSHKSVKRYHDRNYGDIRKTWGGIGNDKYLITVKEVFGGGDLFCRAFQMDRSLCPCINDHGHKRRQ